VAKPRLAVEEERSRLPHVRVHGPER
jgi:hypothetical protein